MCLSIHKYAVYHEVKMNTEIERKYLIESLPEEITLKRGIPILQGYVRDLEKNKEVRIRLEKDKYYKTIKFGKGETRFEENIELNKDEFSRYWKTIEKREIIEKIRYKIPYKRHCIELDIYSGSLEGLITAEVEFINAKESKNFIPPTWFKKEVTLDERYKNGCLVRKGIPKNI
jgi:adenylate cyclase